MFAVADNALVFKMGNETVLIEPWGKDSLRVRTTLDRDFIDNDWGLTEKIDCGKAEMNVTEEGGWITNGRLSARVNNGGVISFFRDGVRILHEFKRFYDADATKHSCCLKIRNRQYYGLPGGHYQIFQRFEANDGEKLYGMGQYAMPYLDLKGCSLELAQKNSQISIPFAISSLGYGFLWNNPAVGHAAFNKNMTEWLAESSTGIDYWITVGENPKEIIEKYTACTGRAPVMSDEYYGFWQCKLRYRTQEEVLTVARKYKELGIHLDVIVIDFFHWPRQGDWCFDKEYWPDPKAMCDELHAMGTKVMVSVWPNVDKKCTHWQEMADKGYLVRTEQGSNQTYDFQGDCAAIDLTNPDAREYLWDICKKNYADYGIDMFWLDNAEPDLFDSDYRNFRYQIGTANEVTNIYPKYFSQAFYEGMKDYGYKNFVNLERCCWVGSQKYNQVLWNGDVQSTWECLRDSVSEGLNMGLAGIPWWTTDAGGFMWGNVHDPAFIELLERWFQWAVFTPILRLHGDRDPHDIPPLDKDPERGYGGGYLFTGADNEIWSYGEKTQEIMTAAIRQREGLKDYIGKVMKEAAKNGSPVMRTMFYEFPDDPNCWEVSDQYMFGSEYLVAPVLEPGIKNRSVYLPAGKWKDIRTGEVHDGGQLISAATPRENIPVFQKL